MENVEIIRSRRKTLCIEIRQEQVLVRAPLRVSNAEITRFLQEKQSWIESHLAKARAREEAKQHVPLLTDAEIRLLAHEAKALIPDRVAYYARRLNVAYGSKDPLGQLHRQGKPEFQLSADARSPGSARQCDCA